MKMTFQPKKRSHSKVHGFSSKTCKRKKEIIRIGHSNVTFFSLNFHGWRIACSFRNH